MRQVELTTLRGGINRLKIKGVSKADVLYDLTNAYITAAGTIVAREGTIRNAALNSSTVGLCAANGVLNVFAKTLIGVPGGYQCNVLVHPTDATQNPVKIWYAKPMMGFLYVVCQFGNGDIFHYWLQSGGVWAANTVYFTDNIVTPSTPNGLAFKAVRDLPPQPTWAADTTTAVNAIVEPTAYTGFVYKAIAVAGTNPHTGSVEPVWPKVENGTIQEFGDFSDTQTAASAAVTSTPQALGSTITDRYGNSQTIAGNGTNSGNATTTVPASTAVTTWAPGTLYAPGAVVRPTTGQGAFVNAIPNGDFENGNDGNWILSGAAFNAVNMYQGLECVALTANNNTVTATMNNFGLVTPGQSVTASAYLNPNNTTTDLTMYVVLRFYDAGDAFISSVASTGQQNPGYRQTSVTGVAPANAAHVRVQIQAGNGTSSKTGYVDLVTWSLEQPAAVSNFLYEAVQSVAGTSATTEPTWPTISGNTVVDNTVTWKAIGTSIITWQAIPIMKSGGAEPTWPTTVGISVKDNTMSWVCINRQVPTPHPSKAVAIAASHVFNGDNDIVDFSAAVNPLDWITANNAGYLPTGLNNYGDNPVAMLTLYRSNLMVFNAGGYQMWQVDPDPANMALLDAQAIGSIWPRAAQSVGNDLLFLTETGVRNLGTVGATANMQIGNSGQPVDPLVKAQLQLGTYDPLSLYYPGRGQYWLIFGPQAFVLMMNGAGMKTWSRYIFPDSITDYALSGGKLFLRTAGNLVWQLDAATQVDDSGGANIVFNSVIQWPYLDMSSGNLTDALVGVDFVGDGQASVQIGFNESDQTSYSDNAGFGTSASVTAPYTVVSIDTTPGTPIPFMLAVPSLSLIMTFASNQTWTWQEASFYLNSFGGGGATG
jgi:hypothetical protein